MDSNNTLNIDGEAIQIDIQSPTDHEFRVMEEKFPKLHIACLSDELLAVFDTTDQLVVRMTYDGNVEFGDGYTPTQSAKLFWQIMADTCPGAIQQPKEYIEMTGEQRLRYLNACRKEDSIQAIMENGSDTAYNRAMKVIE